MKSRIKFLFACFQVNIRMIRNNRLWRGHDGRGRRSVRCGVKLSLIETVAGIFAIQLVKLVILFKNRLIKSRTMS